MLETNQKLIQTKTFYIFSEHIKKARLNYEYSYHA
jgi:hypothetical protein